jgi:hypothetical protein
MTVTDTTTEFAEASFKDADGRVIDTAWTDLDPHAVVAGPPLADVSVVSGAEELFRNVLVRHRRQAGRLRVTS